MARERRSYELNALLELLRGMARETQTDLNALATEVKREYVETGVISADNARRILALTFQAQISNREVLSVLNLADAASIEDALREAEQLHIVQKAVGS